MFKGSSKYIYLYKHMKKTSFINIRQISGKLYKKYSYPYTSYTPSIFFQTDAVIKNTKMFNIYKNMFK